jgi:hypothetical protein
MSTINDLAQSTQQGTGLGWRVAVLSDGKRFLVSLDRIEEFLRSPDVPGQLHRAEAVAISISQGAPNGVTAGLALQLVAALGATDRFPDVPAYMVSLDTLLRRLREALLASDQG